MTPSDAVLAVTYRCNAKCAICGIWRSDPGDDPPVELFRKLPPFLTDINLTGGEPFLRDDLPEIHAACRKACRYAHTIISTNGLLTERIVEQMRAMAKVERRIGIAVSIDGPAEVHDRVRGVPGLYAKAMETIEALRKARFRNLRIAFTGSPETIAHMTEVYNLSRDMGVQFTCAIEHSSQHYFHSSGPAQPMDRDELQRQFGIIMRRELASLRPKRWGRAYFLWGLYAFATGRGRLLPCRAGRSHFFMDARGDVFTCNAAPFRMGNLLHQDFESLWTSFAASRSRGKASTCRRGCWMMCTARPSIRAARLRVLAWALKRKVFGLSLEPDGEGGS